MCIHAFFQNVAPGDGHEALALDRDFLPGHEPLQLLVVHLKAAALVHEQQHRVGKPAASSSDGRTFSTWLFYTTDIILFLANFLYNMGKIGREAAEYGREAPQNMPVIDVKEDT